MLKLSLPTIVSLITEDRRGPSTDLRASFLGSSIEALLYLWPAGYQSFLHGATRGTFLAPLCFCVLGVRALERKAECGAVGKGRSRARKSPRTKKSGKADSRARDRDRPA
jgi:hypothetical protein